MKHEPILNKASLYPIKKHLNIGILLYHRIFLGYLIEPPGLEERLVVELSVEWNPLKSSESSLSQSESISLE